MTAEEMLEALIQARRADRLREALDNAPCRPPKGWITDRDALTGTPIPQGYVQDSLGCVWRPPDGHPG